MKILILFAHPALHKSHINRQLIGGLTDMKGITFHDLYEYYPDYDIDIKAEQKLLMEHDCIIFHHPMYWYSMPALLKEWTDLVLTHGWAYGSTGTALKNKLFFSAITTGGPKKAFQSSGLHNHTMRELLAPVDLTARKCNMKSLPPFVVHGAHAIQSAELQTHKDKYIRLLQCITDDQFDIQTAMTLDYLNDYNIKKGI